jgi:hypothetical protein
MPAHRDAKIGKFGGSVVVNRYDANFEWQVGTPDSTLGGRGALRHKYLTEWLTIVQFRCHSSFAIGCEHKTDCSIPIPRPCKGPGFVLQSFANHIYVPFPFPER